MLTSGRVTHNLWTAAFPPCGSPALPQRTHGSGALRRLPPKHRVVGTPSPTTRRPARAGSHPARSRASVARGCAYWVDARGKPSQFRRCAVGHPDLRTRFRIRTYVGSPREVQISSSYIWMEMEAPPPHHPCWTNSVLSACVTCQWLGFLGRLAGTRRTSSPGRARAGRLVPAVIGTDALPRAGHTTSPAVIGLDAPTSAVTSTAAPSSPPGLEALSAPLRDRPGSP